MADAKLIQGWTEWRFRKAKEVLLRMGLVRLHRQGRRLGQWNEPDLFVLSDRM